MQFLTNLNSEKSHKIKIEKTTSVSVGINNYMTKFNAAPRQLGRWQKGRAHLSLLSLAPKHTVPQK